MSSWARLLPVGALVLVVAVGGRSIAPALADPAAAAKASARDANTRGMGRYRAKDYAGAAVQFRAAIALDADYVLAHYNLASMAALTGDKATVLAELRWLRASADPAAGAALAKAPTDPDLRSMIDDPEVRALIAPPAGDAAACGAACQQVQRDCEGKCDQRGCMRVCEVASVGCQSECDAGVRPDGLPRMRAWLKGPLTGRDNDVANMRVATIQLAGDNLYSYDAPAVYTAYIKNQFGFTCALRWAPDGAPAALTDCKAGQVGWLAVPAEISLRCVLDRKHRRDRCEGAFTLRTTDGFDQDAGFVLQRALP